MANSAVVYSRTYGEHELRFDTSGGLIHYSLVMQDKETDTYWSIMTGDALAGELRGTDLNELPLGTKTTWRDWVAKHPETKVLSVDGVEHVTNNPYDNYFTSEEGFRGSSAEDDRLPTKAAIYAFQLDGQAYAVPFESFVGGATFDLGDKQVFLYRPANVAIFHSTVGYVSSGPGFSRNDAGWRYEATKARFDRDAERFVGGGKAPQTLSGFDTFWFNWSMTHPKTKVLGQSES